MIQNGNIEDVVKSGITKKENIKELEKAESKIRELTDFKNGNTIKIIHKYRAKNKTGALILER